MPLRLQIVTPQAKVFDAEVETVVLPTVQGEVGILPGHLPLLTMIQAGELRVVQNGATNYLAVSKGFAEVSNDRLSVLTESAIDVEEIDEAQVEEAIASARAALEEAENTDPEELERLETQIQYATAQLLLRKKKR